MFRKFLYDRLITNADTIVLMTTKTTTTLVIIGLMAALSFAAIATVVNPVEAVGPPSNRGTATASCAASAQGPSAQNCAIRGP